MFLKKTPKIISLVKEWNPAIHLIGFKLLVDVSEDYLIEIARKSLIKNQADLIIANDLTQISANQHRAIFVVMAKALVVPFSLAVVRMVAVVATTKRAGLLIMAYYLMVLVSTSKS